MARTQIARDGVKVVYDKSGNTALAQQETQKAEEEANDVRRKPTNTFKYFLDKEFLFVFSFFI